MLFRSMLAGDFVEFEAVHVWNISNGNRFETYVIRGEAQTSTICVNGAAAHLVKPNDLVIIAAFTDVPENKCRSFVPKVVFVDERNQVMHLSKEIAGPRLRSGYASPDSLAG